MNEALRPWLAAARPDQALLAPLAVAVGSSYAHFDAQHGPGLSAHAVVTLGAFAAATGVNLVDHAWDRSAAAPPDPKSTARPVLVPVEAWDAFVAGAGALTVAALCGIGLVSLAGSAALGYGTLAVILGVARGAPMVGLDTLGWGLGDLANILALGPLAAEVGYGSQAGAGSSGAFLVGIPVGLAAASPLFARHLAAIGSAAARPSTTLEQLGRRDARLTLVALPLLAAAAVLIVVRAGEYGRWASTALAPLAAAAVAAWRLPEPASEDEYGRWTRWAIGCAAAAIVLIGAAIRIASPD